MSDQLSSKDSRYSFASGWFFVTSLIQAFTSSRNSGIPAFNCIRVSITSGITSITTKATIPRASKKDNRMLTARRTAFFSESAGAIIFSIFFIGAFSTNAIAPPTKNGNTTSRSRFMIPINIPRWFSPQ